MGTRHSHTRHTGTCVVHLHGALVVGEAQAENAQTRNTHVQYTPLFHNVGHIALAVARAQQGSCSIGPLGAPEYESRLNSRGL